MLDVAKKLALAGVAVHWLHAGEKRPIGEDWSTKPVNSVRELERTFKKGNNIGIRLGRYSALDEGNHLYAFDVDVKGDTEADVEEAYRALRKILPDWQDFPYVESGRRNGSMHVYFVSQDDMPSRKLAHSSEKVEWFDKAGKKHASWRWEIELFGTKKQVACPPSIHPDTGYKYEWGREIDFDDLESIELKEADIRSLEVDGDDEKPRSLLGGSGGLEDAHNRAPMNVSKKQVYNILEGLSEEWSFDYDKWLKVGMALHHQFEGSDKGLKLWHWFSAVEDAKYDEDVLDEKWKGFGKGEFEGRKPVRLATLMKYSKVDAATAEEDNEETVEDAILRINKQHALIRNQGKVLVLNEEEDGRLTWSKDRDFLNWFADDLIDVWGPPNAKGKSKIIQKSVAILWWRSKLKRKYEGVTMRPEQSTGKLYNLWRGWSVVADAEASCDLFLDHIYDNVCDGDPVLFRWVIGWMAHMVQKPWEKPGVALVFKGKRGVGKTIVGEVLARLLVQHTVKVAQAKHLTGAFNAHLSNALFVRVEEAFWVGDKSGAQVLKDMVTGDSVRIEQKGVDSGEIPSFHRFIFTSNEQWVIPAGMEERRFAVIEVADHEMQNRKYFRKMMEELRDGGYGALLHHLKNFDISKLDVGKAPVTEALAEQKLASLSGIEAWWAEVLSDEEPPGRFNDFENEDGWEDSTVILPTVEVRDHYAKWMKSRKYQGDPLTAPLFTKRLLELCPSITISKPRSGDGKQVKSLKFPNLEICKTEFEAHFGQKLFD